VKKKRRGREQTEAKGLASRARSRSFSLFPLAGAGAGVLAFFTELNTFGLEVVSSWAKGLPGVTPATGSVVCEGARSRKLVLAWWRLTFCPSESAPRLIIFCTCVATLDDEGTGSLDFRVMLESVLGFWGGERQAHLITRLCSRMKSV